MSDEYRKLLDEIRPRAINDDAEYQRAKAEASRLVALHAAQGDAINEMIALLSTLLMAYELEQKWERERDSAELIQER